MSKRERVHGVLGYYDGVLDGVADFQGHPHAFVLDSGHESAAPVYCLTPISSETMELFDEVWQIWLRWERSNVDDVGPDTIPALAQDRERYAEISPKLDELLSTRTSASFMARGEFLPRVDADPQKDGRWAMDVVWSEA